MLEISAHGLNHFFATYRYQKIFAVFWLIVFALSASLCIVDFTALFRKYAKRHISTEIKLGHGSIPFPAVTVCNLNPFRKSAIAEYEGLAALNEAFLDINYENPTRRKKRGADGTVINVRRKRNIYPVHVKNEVSYAVGEAGASCDEACAAEGMSCVTNFPGMTDLSNVARQQLMKDAVNNEQTGVEAPSNTGCCHGGTYPSYDAALLLYGYDWHEGYTVPLCNSTAVGHNRLCECDGTSSATTTTAAVTTTAAGTTSAAATTAAVTTAAVTTAGVTTAAATTAAVTTAGVTTAAATTAAVTTAAVTTAGVTTAAATTAAVTTAGVTTAAATTAAVTTAAVTTAGVTTAAATTAAVTTAAVTTAAAATTAAATTAALTTITTPASPPVTPNFPIPSGFVFSTCDPGTACQNSTGCLTDAGSLQQYCVCELGWNGDQCDVNIDDCLSRPCLNGGVCIDGVNTYSCDCTDTGFSGLNCENDIDECIGNTCDSSDTCADYLGGYTCVSEPSITEAKERILGAETTTTVGDSEAVQINTQDLRAFMVLDLLLQTDWSSEGSRLGHLRSDFLKWCAYQNSTRCDELFATVDFDADLGNCFTFNQNGSKTVERAGQDSSLNVEVFLQQDAYLPQTSEVGALIVLHSSQTPIFATGETYKVAPGFHVNYDISYKKLRRLPPPWGTCVEHKSEVPHYFYEGIYTQQGCEKSQYQAAVIDTCGCGDPRYPLPPDASYCRVHDRACLSDAALFATKTDSSSCQEACWGETWRVITTAAVWPQSSSIIDGCTGKECVSKFRKDNAKLSISYRTLTYLVYSEYPTYEVINLVSNLGSIVGVMIGMSVTSVFELLILSILRQHGNSPAAYKSAIQLAGLKTEE